jgi:hypothetical protein
MQSTVKLTHRQFAEAQIAYLKANLRRTYTIDEAIRAMKLYWTNNLNSAYNHTACYNPAIEALKQRWGKDYAKTLDNWPHDSKIEILRGSIG